MGLGCEYGTHGLRLNEIVRVGQGHGRGLAEDDVYDYDFDGSGEDGGGMFGGVVEAWTSGGGVGMSGSGSVGMEWGSGDEGGDADGELMSIPGHVADEDEMEETTANAEANRRGFFLRKRGNPRRGGRRR
jgi:hypothetical protein